MSDTAKDKREIARASLRQASSLIVEVLRSGLLDDITREEFGAAFADSETDEPEMIEIPEDIATDPEPLQAGQLRKRFDMCAKANRIARERGVFDQAEGFQRGMADDILTTLGNPEWLVWNDATMQTDEGEKENPDHGFTWSEPYPEAVAP